VATINFRNAYFWLQGVDLSADVESITLNFGSEMLDETAMGDDTRVNKGGLKTWSLDFNVHQDFATTTDPDAGIWPREGSTTCFEIRAANSTVAATNPSWSGIGVIESYTPVGGSVGSLLDAAGTIQSAGSLTRAITSYASARCCA
jgi:hypothetical protein